MPIVPYSDELAIADTMTTLNTVRTNDLSGITLAYRMQSKIAGYLSALHQFEHSLVIFSC